MGFISLAIFLASLSLFVGGYFLSSAFYYKRHDVKYSFKRMFPYEFNYPNSFKRNIYGNIAIVLSMVGIIVFYIYKMSNTNSQSITIYVLVALSIITAALIGCLLFMPLQFLRTHIILSTLAMTSSFAMPALGALLGYESLKMVELNYEKALSIIAIVTLLKMIGIVPKPVRSFMKPLIAHINPMMDKTTDPTSNVRELDGSVNTL